jgi:hypothetical protein
VRYGRGAAPDGMLPIYSVDSEAEAKALLVVACPTNLRGEFIARELAEHQTLENLWAFGERLERTHKWMQKRKERHGRKPTQ